ncbi:MAG: hypothetical protein HYR93_08500, partial [Chloroflexi bacterium]|nr:hypothetical protein [Chloroflexota bacterium]
MKRATLLLLFIALLFVQPSSVRAQSNPSCSFQPDGSIICTTGGGNDGGGNDGGGDNNGGTCIPGNHLAFKVLEYDAGTCKVFPIRVDNCTGEIIGISEQIGNISCELPDTLPPQNPCTIFSVGAGGITCENTGWKVSARVTFPEIYLDVR